MASYFIIFIGSGIGGALRYGAGLLAISLFGAAFPIGTMAINIVGSFAMALVAEWFVRNGGIPDIWRLFLTTGIIGGFTTFSTFSLDAVALYERGEIGMAVTYVAGSVFVSIAAFFAGLWVMRTFG